MIKLVNYAHHLFKAVFLPALMITGIILALAAVYVQKKHREAEAFLDQIDLQARNTSGATFYASKKRLFVGQELSRNAVVEYIKSNNYVQCEEPNRAGSYCLQGSDTLVITPRLAEFQPVTLRFKHQRIQTIEVASTLLNPLSGKVNEAAIEPAPLGAFITSIDGDEASRMFVRRYTLQYDDFRDTHLPQAIMASEDSRFMQHDGTRFERILINLLKRHQGGSSITAQVIKNAVSLDKTHTVTRKIDEIFLSSALEQRMSKENILTLYVNNVFLGGGKGSANLYGFLAAAEEYFGKKNIKELTLSETCTLMAMLPQPNVFLNQARQGDYAQLTQWRDRVLRRLYENWPDKYPAASIDAARKEAVHFINQRHTELPLDTLCRGFIDYAIQRQPLINFDNLSPVSYSGLHIYTSIDPDLMREGQRLLSDYLPLPGYGLIRVFKIVITEDDIEYWATNDLQMSELTRIKYANYAWTIENYHRGIKQFCNVERAQVRAGRAQRNHIGLALRAFLRLEVHCYHKGISWFEAKTSIIREAVRGYLAKPLYTLNPTA